MSVKRLLRLSNWRVRVVVGLFLAGLFAIQCTRTEAFRENSSMTVINGQIVGENSPALLKKVDQLAKTDHVALLELCLENYRQKYHDFTCTFAKQEVLRGENKPEQVIQVKHLANPFSVAMTWVKNAPLGDKVLYVEGKYNNQMLVRPTSSLARMIVPVAVRQPDGEEAMKNTLRPVNLFGFGRGMQSLLDIYRLAASNGDLRIEFGGYGKTNNSDKRTVVQLIRYLPNKPEYHTAAAKTNIFIDIEHMVPLIIEGYDWEGRLTSRYEYSDVKFNVGLTDADFTPSANGIKDPK